MKVGDKIRVTWTDGLVLVGRYIGTERGYIILAADDGHKIVCDPRSVTFEVINESR